MIQVRRRLGATLSPPQAAAQKLQKSESRSKKSRARFRLDFPTIFGSNGRGDQVSLYEQLANDGGSARFSSPCLPLSVSPEEYATFPVMFYIPGFDGTGMAASRQFPSLMKAFEFVTFTVPMEDRDSFGELLEVFIDFLDQYVEEHAEGRPVYLLGESFGALLALAVASKCPEKIDRLVLVNPATSYEQSIWPFLGPLVERIPNELYTGVSFFLSPLLGNPLSLLSYKVDLSKPIPNQIGDIVDGILELFGTLGFIGDVLTPERVAQKIQLVQQGVQHTTPLLPQIPQRTLLLVSEGDWMLPSGSEKDRLPNLMRRCRVRSMGLRSHALLQEGGVDLVRILNEEGFYVRERRFSSKSTSEHELNAFGRPVPIEMPTEIERQKAASTWTALSALTSPVFYSTNAENKVMPGVDDFPAVRPLLIVGNHQLMAQDMFALAEWLLREKDILIRGLAHPVFFSEATGGNNGSDFLVQGIGGQTTKDILTTFGAVKANARNYYSLLRHGECILLYPGGTRESFKLKNEKYKLFWPHKPEFVRMAAKFEATIITVASVGYEETFEIVADREDILKTPFLGELIKQRLEASPTVRSGMKTDVEDYFLPPLVRPSVPQRQYFLFGKPFHTTLDDYRDRDQCEALYRQIKNQLEENIDYLRQKSKEDPYRDFVKRLLYENTNGGKQAPSFIP